MSATGPVPLVTQVYETVKSSLEGHWEQRQRQRVEDILAGAEAPLPYDAGEVFSQLQEEYSPREEYGWDAYSMWWRGIQRAPHLIDLSDLREPGARVLEAACGDGMTGAVLASYGHAVTLHDLEDWRDPRARELPFVPGDLASPLHLEPESFDLIFSYNAFEHIGDPAAALGELVRLCRTGGMIYLDFGPLFAGPWGLHAWTALRMPYPQFLFSPEFYQRKIEELGLFDLGRRTTTLQPLNRWRVQQFEEIWRGSGCEIVSSHAVADVDHLEVIERFPQAFRGRNLTYDDVTTDQVAVLLRKP